MFSPGADTEVISFWLKPRLLAYRTFFVSLKYFSKSEGSVVKRKRSGLSTNAHLDNSFRIVRYDACYESSIQKGPTSCPWPPTNSTDNSLWACVYKGLTDVWIEKRSLHRTVCSLRTEKEANCGRSIPTAPCEKLHLTNETLGTRLSGTPCFTCGKARSFYIFVGVQLNIVVVFLTTLLFMSFRPDFVIQLFLCSLTFVFLSILCFQFVFFN